MLSKIYILFCVVSLFTIAVHSNPAPWSEDGSDDWKPNPPVSIRPPLVPPGEQVPNCVVSINRGVYFNNCTRQPTVHSIEPRP